MFRRLKTWTVAVCLLACEGLVIAPVAQASMQSVITGMYTAMGAPTAANLPSGSVLSLGYVATRNPIISPNVIAFAPPNISAGCGGINMFFGSWSFINSQQLQQLITAIGQAAGPFLFQMAIQAMCPQCSAILSDLSKKIQEMNQLAHNSCQLAAGIYSGHGADMLASMSHNVLNMFKAQNGSSPDSFLSLFGSDNTTNNPSKSWAQLADDVAANWGYSATGSPTNAPQSGNGACTDFVMSGSGMKIGNMTWKALVSNNAASAFGDGVGLGSSTATTEILMSLVGTDIVLPSAPQAAPSGSASTPNAAANNNATSAAAAQGAVSSFPPSLTLKDLVDGVQSAQVMQCHTVSAPNGVTYEATHGTCGSSGPLSPLGCMNVTADQQQTLGSLGYIGIKNMVHCALFGVDTTGNATTCAQVGSPPGLANDITGANPSPLSWGQAEQQVLMLSPINFLPLVQPVSRYPAAVNHILTEVEPYIVANIAALYGHQVSLALQQGFQNNNGGWQMPDSVKTALTQIQNQTNLYVAQMNGSVEKFNQLRQYVNAFSASLHTSVPGASPAVSK
jgi:conjugative transfer pilus assembly protein TraH